MKLVYLIPPKRKKRGSALRIASPGSVVEDNKLTKDSSMKGFPVNHRLTDTPIGATDTPAQSPIKYNKIRLSLSQSDTT